MMEGVKSKDPSYAHKKFKAYARVRILFLPVDYHPFTSSNRKQSNCKFCTFRILEKPFQSPLPSEYRHLGIPAADWLTRIPGSEAHPPDL